MHRMESSDQEFLKLHQHAKALRDIQEHMYNLSREIRNLKLVETKDVKDEHSVTEMKNAF